MISSFTLIKLRPYKILLHRNFQFWLWSIVFIVHFRTNFKVGNLICLWKLLWLLMTVWIIKYVSWFSLSISFNIALELRYFMCRFMIFQFKWLIYLGWVMHLKMVHAFIYCMVAFKFFIKLRSFRRAFYNLLRLYKYILILIMIFDFN